MGAANDLKQSVHARLLVARNLFTMVNNTEFLAAYELATNSQREYIKVLIDASDVVNLAKIKRQLLRPELESLTCRELRKLGQDYGIRGYNTLPKASLLSALKQKEVANEQSSRPAT